MTRRTADVARDLAELAEEVDDLQRVTRRLPDAGGPVEVPDRSRLPNGYVDVIADLAPDRRTHILDGDPPHVRGGKGGGHRAGTGRPNKTEFPARWSDDEIIRIVMQTARRPQAVVWQSDRGTFRVTAHHDGVDVDVVVDPGGAVMTAYPKPGGRGVVRNP